MDLRDNYKPVNRTEYSTHMYAEKAIDLINNHNAAESVYKHVVYSTLSTSEFCA